MRTRKGRLALLLGLAALAVLIVAPSAGAVYVSGKQVPTGFDKYEMTGGLLGKWKITEFKTIKEGGRVFKAKGKEKFNGCLDADRDNSCDGDVTGQLYFKFTYWGSFGDDGFINLGTCAHRVYDGKEGFAGASGFLMMVDTPAPGSDDGFKTHYEGDINPAGTKTATPPDGPGSC
jgi:hypothetical protein